MKRLKKAAALALMKGPWSSLTIGPPKAAVWDVEASRGSSLKIEEADRPTNLDLRQPDLLIGLKIEDLAATLFPDIKPLRLCRLQRGRYFQPTFAVIDREDRLLHDYTQGWEQGARFGNYVFEEARLPRVRRLEGASLLLDVRSHNRNYFHWIVEGLTKFAALQKLGHDLGKFSHFIMSSASRPFLAESLEAMGVPRAKIVDAASFRHIEAEELYAVSDTKEHVYPCFIDFMRARFPFPKNGERRRRIYISREDAPKRRVENEEELAPILRRYNFERVVLTGMSWKEQVALFQQTECTIAPHGAGIANALFCPAGSTLIELQYPTYTKGLYWRMASALGMDYSSIAGRGGKRHHSNMVLRPEDLATVLAHYFGP